MKEHFSIFVYPFEHHFSDRKRHAFLQHATEEGWQSWISCAGPDGLGLYNRCKTWFHPPTLKALFPELFRLARCEHYYHAVCPARPAPCPKDPKDQNACQKDLWFTLRESADEEKWRKGKSLWDSFQQEDTIRLRRGDKADESWEFHCSVREGDKAMACRIDFKLLWTEAYLFPNGIGLLCFKIKLLDSPAKESIHLDRLVLFHQKFRDIDEQGRLLTTTGTSPDGLTKPEFINRLLNPLCDRRSRVRDELIDIRDLAYRLKIFSFISIDSEATQPNELDSYYSSEDALDGLLYEIGTVTAPGTLAGVAKDSPTWQPSITYLRDVLLSKNRISLWRYWRGLAIKDTVVFVSSADKGQPSSTQYEDIYFPLYVYVYNLKMQLFWFSNELNLRSLRGRHKRMQELISSFFMFRNEYWFSEISPNFQMAILFEKFKFGLELQNDYDGVVAEVNDIYQYQETLRARILNNIVSVLTGGALIAGFLGMNSLLEPPQWERIKENLNHMTWWEFFRSQWGLVLENLGLYLHLAILFFGSGAILLILILGWKKFIQWARIRSMYGKLRKLWRRHLHSG